MNPVICSIARTPIGRFNDVFSPLTAMQLGGFAIRGALERAGIGADSIDEVVFGHVLQAGQGQITSRQAAVVAVRARDHPERDGSESVPGRAVR